MLHVLSHKSKIRQAAISVKMERELASLMVYYPLLERVLSRYANAVNDTARLALIIKVGMEKISIYRKSVPMREDNQRLKVFLSVFLNLASPLFITRCCVDGLRFSTVFPSTCCGNEVCEEITPNSSPEQRTRALVLIGSSRILQ